MTDVLTDPVPVLVPRRPDDGHRDRLWNYVRAWWRTEFPEWPVITGYDTRHGPFNRAEAINSAAANAGPAWDVAIVADGDTVPDPRLVRLAVDFARQTGRYCFPHTRWRGLSQAGTEMILRGRAAGSWRPWVVETLHRTASSCLAVPRTLWDEVGGFDEGFVGWGGEDVAFSLACWTLRGGKIDRLGGDVYHLWHARPLHADYAPRLDRYVAAQQNPDAMRRLLDEVKAAR